MAGRSAGLGRGERRRAVEQRGFADSGLPADDQDAAAAAARPPQQPFDLGGLLRPPVQHAAT